MWQGLIIYVYTLNSSRDAMDHLFSSYIDYVFPENLQKIYGFEKDFEQFQLTYCLSHLVDGGSCSGILSTFII